MVILAQNIKIPGFVIPTLDNSGKVVPVVMLTAPDRQNLVNGNINARRGVVELLAILKNGNGVIPINNAYSLEAIYTAKDSQLRNIFTLQELQLAQIYANKEQEILKWVGDSYFTDRTEETLGETVPMVIYFQDTIEE